MKLRLGFTDRKAIAIPTVFGVGAFAADGASAAVNAPANDAANDILILVVHADANDTLGGTTGYAHVTGSPLAFGSSRLHVMWKRATDGSNDLTVTATDGFQGLIIALRGVVTTGDPWAVISNDTQASATALVIAGLTVSAAKSLILICGAHEINGGSGAQLSGAANSNLLSVTEQADDSSTAGTPDGGVFIISGRTEGQIAIGNTTATLASASATGRIVMAFSGVVS